MADDPVEVDETPDEPIEVELEDDETPTDPEGAEGDEEDGDDVDPDAEAGAAPPERAAPSRGDRQMAELRRANRERAEENARLTRQLDDLRRAPPVQHQAVESPAQRAERFALMSPEERIREEVRESLERNDRNNQTLMHQLMEQSDRTDFEAHAVVNPLARKLGPEVERRLADLRTKGQNLPRKVVLTYLIGERVLAQQTKKAPGRKAQETARPVRARGDGAAPGRDTRRSGGDSVAAMERRLENQQI